MHKIIPKFKGWVPVKINENASIEGVENLLAIEELTDYNLADCKGNVVSSKSKKRKRPKKRKTAQADSEVPSKVTRGNNVFTVTNTEDSDEECTESTEDNKELYLPWSNIFVPDVITKALVEKGYNQPTEIQRLSIPAAIKGRRDILGAAETGSGKTLAFGIPLIYGILKNLEKLSNDPEKLSEQGLWALILTPTRELAVQIKDHIEVVTKYTPLQVAVIVGGMSSEKQSRILSQKPHIVVATPGRLWDLVQVGEPHFKNIETLKYLVIDETDRMLEANHFPELRSLLERINTDEEAKKARQNFVFSATLTLVHQPPNYIVKKRWKKALNKITLTPSQKLASVIKLLGITDPKTVDITSKTGLASTLSEARILCKFEEKDFYLYYFLMVHPGRTLVFLNSIESVKRLSSLLNLLNVKAFPLHSNMIQKQRLKNLERFSGGNGVLLATDVAARGLDIPATEHVIHYQIPKTSESYVHRSGRTARASRPGLTVLLVSPEEVSSYTRNLLTLNRDGEMQDFPIREDVLRMSVERVKAARQLDLLLLRKKRDSDKRSWLEKAAEEADIILDESLQLEERDSHEEKMKKKAVIVAKKQLEALLNEPISLSSESAVDIVKTAKNKPKLKILKKKKKAENKDKQTFNC